MFSQHFVMFPSKEQIAKKSSTVHCGRPSLPSIKAIFFSLCYNPPLFQERLCLSGPHVLVLYCYRGVPADEGSQGNYWLIK